MLKLEFIIPYHALDLLRRSLGCLAPGMTVSLVAVPASRTPESPAPRRNAAWADRLRVEIVLTDELAEPVMATMLEALNLEGLEVGPVFLAPIREAIRIRTGDRGAFAIR